MTLKRNNQMLNGPGFCKRLSLGLILLISLGIAGLPVSAKLKQLDVFLGFDGYTPEGNWFPVVFEVLNDGPSFEAVFEVRPASFARGQIRQMRVELPTGTRKRFTIPVFGATRGQSSWDVIVRDAKGNRRDEIWDIKPRRSTSQKAAILGAVARTLGGIPVFPEVDRQFSSLQPYAARIQPELFPDTPIALQGLAALYLNAEKARDLKENQAMALSAWVAGGGHLIVGLHQPSDLQGSPWLKDLVPFAPSGLAQMAVHAQLENWFTQAGQRLCTLAYHTNLNYPAFRNLKKDEAFERAELTVVSGKVLDGQVIVGSREAPLALAAQRGMGVVTLLTFSPEVEPFRSWELRKYFWAKLCDLPPAWFSNPAAKQGPSYSDYAGMSVDSIFGAIVDSRQVRKLPVGWLLLLLLAYLGVIGPLDHYVLKKLNKQMLTWLTFPAYVVMFSGLIYFIGYKLRAGDIEWNELHVVDIIPGGSGKATLRGKTFAAIYSPANARYPLESRLGYATLRDEYSGAYSAGMDTTRSVIEQRGNSFTASVSVPVWTSQLYVGDWWQATNSAPFTVETSGSGADTEVRIKNNLSRPLTGIQVVTQNTIYKLAEIAAGKTAVLRPKSANGTWVHQYTATMTDRFYHAASYRRQALGGNESARPSTDDLVTWPVGASFLNAYVDDQGYKRFFSPRGFDLSPHALRGDVIVFAWLRNQLLVNPLNHEKFSAQRSTRDTFLRLVVPAAYPTR